jgi:outer membrane immunogenic protein
MKRLAFAAALSVCAASSVLAADFPPYAAPPPPGPAPYYVPPPVVPPYSWGGFYVGGNLGAGWSGVGTFSDSAGSAFSSTTSSTFVGGGQFGLNYEFYSGVVIGAEVMFDWAPNTQNTLNISNPVPAPLGSSATATINSRWLTTVTGELGYAWDRVLVYGKAGGAWVGADTPNLTTPGGVVFPVSGNSSNSGWTAGIGLAWAFAGPWSVRAEYDFVGLSNQTFTVAPGPAPFGGDTINSNNRNIQLLTVGLNYKFGGWWW